ncbi:MAG: flavoprotein, partial [Micrococcales bacterium]
MRIVLGVTGGIAAYKATSIIRLLSEAGHDVKVVPTQNALRFIGATTLEALSHNSVDPDLYTDVDSVKHIELGKSADLVIVAPATASFLARYAAGLADDLLGNILLATTAPVLVAPAMHTEMW